VPAQLPSRTWGDLLSQRLRFRYTGSFTFELGPLSFLVLIAHFSGNPPLPTGPVRLYLLGCARRLFLDPREYDCGFHVFAELLF